MFVLLCGNILLCFSPTICGSSSGESLTPKDVSLSKSLSWLLRHGAIDEGLQVSEDGFIQLEDVLQHRLFAHRCSPTDIRRVVHLSKNRFTLRANPVTGIYEIRANSGHTFKDQNNQEGQKSGTKSEVKQNRGRSIPQPGLKLGKNAKNNNPKNQKIDDLLKNYNIPVGNIASDENHKRRGKKNLYDNLMKYPELKKALLWILRYGSEKEGLTVKRHGYVPVDEILTHPYFKNKCMREDIITVANNEPHNFKLRESPSSQQLYIRARKEHPIKQEQEDWSVIPDVIYLPLGFVIHGINGSEWDFVSEHGLKVPRGGYLHCSPYYAADSWHTRGVTKYDDIYIHIDCHAAMQDGIEFFLTPEYSVATKGDKDGFIRTQYFKKVIDAKTGRFFINVSQELDVHCQWPQPFHYQLAICFRDTNGVVLVTYCSPMAQTMTTSNVVCEACNLHLHPASYESHLSGKKHKFKQEQYDKKHKTVFVTGTNNFSAKDLEKIFSKYGKVFKVQKNPHKPFAFIQFVDKNSVENTLNARVFVGGRRLFVHRYDDNRNRPPNQEDNNEKSRKLSETLSNTSQTDDAEKGPQTGVKDLPVQIADPESSSEGDVLLWQARDFVSQVELSTEMYLSLNQLKSDVESLFQPVMPGCQVVVFGSCGSTLAFKNSDVDLFIQTANGEQPKDFVRREAKRMYQSRVFKVVARIPSARVPIVKFEHVPTGWQGDLTANSQLGVCNSQLIRFLVSLDPRIKPLVMVIKYWAKVCGVTGSHNRFTTYSLVMLVVFYLQQLDPPVLPTIAQLQQMSHHKQFSLGWECGFCDEEWRVQSECLSRQNDLSLRQLLTGFFRFYHDHDSGNVICPLLGRVIPAKDFEGEGTDLPDEMFLYREKLREDPKSKFRTDVNFKVQDPFELCLNITRNVTEKCYSVFKEACKVSLELCEKKEDAELLKALFSIDEESLDVGEDNVKININYKEETSESSESSFNQWYELTTEAILLVLKQIYKLDVESLGGEVSSKVKKVDVSQDVHTPINKHNRSKLVFLCSAKANVWNSRRKMSKFMNSMKIALNVFEREVCISNALHDPCDQNLFHVTLSITSLEDLKKGGKGIEVEVKTKKCRHHLVKGFLQSMRNDFRLYLIKAIAFIDKVKDSTPLAEVKESLKELFELKLENLPDLKKLKDKRDEIMTGKGKQEATIERRERIENVLEKALSKDNNPSGETSGESGVKKNILSPKDTPNAETQNLIDEFFKPSSPNQDLKSNVCSDNIEADKFGELLNSIQKIETQSTFTSDDVNPFLASIEKVAFKTPEVSQPVEPRKETGNFDDIRASSESQNTKDEGMKNIIKEKDSTDMNLKLDSKDQNEKVHVSHCEKEESNFEGVESSKKDQNLPIGQEKTDVSEKKEETTFEDNNINSDSKMYLQRPKIHSERPFKQRKPNTFKFNRNGGQGPRRPWNGSRRQPWAGGGPPGCQPWNRQPQPSTAGHGSHNQDYQGNYHGSRRHPTSNWNIRQQRRHYPSLF